MNLFDEHLFDEEMKLFKFMHDKEKKENELIKTPNSAQNNNLHEHSNISSNNMGNSCFIKSDVNNNQECISEKPKKHNSKNNKNKINRQSYYQSQNQFQYNAYQQLMKQQNPVATQFLQPSFQIPKTQPSILTKPNANMKNLSSMSFNSQIMPNHLNLQQQRFQNSNFIIPNQSFTLSSNPIPCIKNDHCDQKNEQNCFDASLRPIKINSNSQIACPANPESSNNKNSVSEMSNVFFQSNASSDVDHFNFGQIIDLNSNENADYDDDDLFKEALENANMRFNPTKLGFIPSAFWSDNEMTFNDIVKSFFQRKNNSKCRFPHKLYNALIFTHTDPSLFPLIGVCWIDKSTILIRRKTFARLLGIRSIEGSLFHQQGNFPSHGFTEIDPKIVKMKFPNFDFSVNRLITHATGVFVYGCTEADIDGCKWNSSNK